MSCASRIRIRSNAKRSNGVQAKKGSDVGGERARLRLPYYRCVCALCKDREIYAMGSMHAQNTAGQATIEV